SAASGGTAVGRACRASFRGRGPDAVSAREPRQARRARAAFAVDRAARRARLAGAHPGCRSFLPRAGPRRTQGRRRQTGHDGCACRLDRLGDLPSRLNAASCLGRAETVRGALARLRRLDLAIAGGAVVTRASSNSCATCATCSTARLNAAWFALE